jgi:hypothetical protein
MFTWFNPFGPENTTAHLHAAEGIVNDGMLQKYMLNNHLKSEELYGRRRII